MKVLVTTGGSPHSEVAIRFCAYIMELLVDHDSPLLTILTVVKHENESPQAQEILSRAAQLLEQSQLNIQTKVRVGHPAEEIIREAEEGLYALVVAGEKQHHGLVLRFILGSTVERVVERAPCPVMIAKGKIGPIRRILLCDSGIEAPSLPDRFVTQLGNFFSRQEEVTILHVMSQISAGPGIRGKQLRASAEELIAEHSIEGQLFERDIRKLARLNVQPQPKVRHGLVVDEILDEAGSGDYDLVVIGAHQGEGWRRILLDDLAHQLITRMDRPIIVVR